MGCQTAGVSPALEVVTAAGVVQGTRVAPGIRRFAGLRYAQPPLGDNRFRPPQPLAPGTAAIDAQNFGPACYQDFSDSDFVWRRGEFARSEDCLLLNIWTSAYDAAAQLPVMVWFHGGSHTGGYAHARIFDGMALASQDVVVVTVNYRLGAFGFLAHPALAAQTEDSSSGNYGLMDKVAALQWVRDHIAAFGGNPDNVTIFGQSAGSMSVCALMTAAAARGLFHKAIGQSAACLNAPVSGSADLTGRAAGERLSAHLGLDSGDHAATATALRALPPAALQAAANASGWSEGPKVVVDGRLLTVHPREKILAGTHHAVPLLAGSMANEGVELLPVQADLDVATLRARLERRYPGQAQTLLQLYAAELAQSPGLAQREIAIDHFMAWAMRAWARANSAAGAASYLYFMQRPTPIFALYTPDDPTIEWPGGPRAAGAYHSGDLAYVFANTRLVGEHWEPADHALAEAMSRYWTNFARSGDPNGPGLPTWPVFDTAQATLVLDADIRVAHGVRGARLDVFDAVQASP